MAREKHSDKGLKTLELMGTKPDDWALPPIKWTQVMMSVPVEQDCPDCYGRGTTYVNIVTGKKATDANYENINDRSLTGWKSKNKYTDCPRCIGPRTKRGMGKITVWKKQLVWVGEVIWAKGTLFDSRFEDAQYRRSNETPSGKDIRAVCELCSKSITSPFCSIIPVQGRGADGRIHGMWIGQDCARKILQVEVVLSEDQKAEMKKSKFKGWILKEQK